MERIYRVLQLLKSGKMVIFITLQMERIYCVLQLQKYGTMAIFLTDGAFILYATLQTYGTMAIFLTLQLWD